MTRRLADTYRPGDLVEIHFAGDPEERWWAARVVRPASPGLWVTTGDGRQWFVTNSRRIRRLPASGTDEPDESGGGDRA